RAKRLPSSSVLPGPTAITLPLLGFSFAVSGRMTPPAVFSSGSSGLTITRSLSGLSFTFLASCSNSAPRRTRSHVLVHALAAAARVVVLLGRGRDEALGREQHARDRHRVLERGAADLRRVDDAR